MKNVLKNVTSVFTKEINIANFHLPFTVLEIMLKLILPIFFSLIIYKLLKKWAKHTISKSKLNENKKAKALSWFKLSFKFTFTVVIVLLIINLFGAEINKYITYFGKLLTHPIVKGISIVTLLFILPILYLGQVVGKFVQKVTDKNLLNYIKLNQGTKQTLSAVIRNVTMVVVILLGLNIIGIDLSLLFGFVGVIGIGLGFGLQSVVANLFAGLVILTSKPVKVGDHIIIDDTEGNLQEVRFLNSVVSTITHESIIIPNSKLIENPVHNFSFDDESIIIKNTVQVSYNSDIDEALNILKQAVEECPYRLKQKEIKTRLLSFDESGITLATICWIQESKFKYDAKSWINLEIWRSLKKFNIEIPYPQLDLHIKK